MTLSAKHGQDFNRPIRFNGGVFDANLFDDVGVDHFCSNGVNVVIINRLKNGCNRFFSGSCHRNHLKCMKRL